MTTAFDPSIFVQETAGERQLPISVWNVNDIEGNERLGEDQMITAFDLNP